MLDARVQQLVRRARRGLYRRGLVVQRPAFPVDEAELARSGRLLPVDLAPEVVATIDAVAPYTQTSPERLAALVAAVEHIVAAGIDGDVVECGVWRGGSMMAVARTLLRLDAADRDLRLYDTYEGMPAPEAVDVDFAGRTMAVGDNAVAVDQVRDAVLATGYAAAHVHLVAGRVQDTLPAQAPERIALLRLDTDWYDSTRHELETLWPRLAPGGILIVDDYGHYEGARRAVDEFFAARPVFLSRIDYTGRLAVKPSG